MIFNFSQKRTYLDEGRGMSLPCIGVITTIARTTFLSKYHQEEPMGRSSLALAIRVLGITFCLMCLGGSLQAQSIQTGKISGAVFEQGGAPVPGVSIEISSSALISEKRMTTTSENGTYVFLSLPLGTYRVAASLPGFKTLVRENIQISAGEAVSVDFQMQMGAVEESITVSAEGPIVDKKASTVDVNLNEELISRVPTNRDAFYDLTLMTPGMFDAGKDSAWLPSPTAYGSGTNENVFLVDGVNSTDPRGGSWGTLVNVNYDTVEEVQIIALGSKAEYGSSTGVAVNVITKQGSNVLHGKAGFYSQLGNAANNAPGLGDDLGEDWLILDPSSRLFGRTEKDREFSVALGGPIVKNRLWFYTAADIVDEDFQKPLWQPLNESKGRYFDAKISAEPIESHNAWFAFHMERNSSAGDTWGDGVPWDPTLQYAVEKENYTISSQWQWYPGSRDLLTFKYLSFWTGWNPSLPSNAPANSGFINWWKWQDFGVNGHFPYIEGHDATRHTFQADMSHYVEEFLGQQDIKFGVQYTTGNGSDLSGYFLGYANFAYPYRWTQNIQYLQDWYGDTGMLWYVNQIHSPPFETVRNFKQLGAFLDDQWTISPRLTLNLGLRVDKMTNRYGTGTVFESPADIHADINGLNEVRDRQGTDDIFDFTNISPRIGGTFALTDDGKTVVRANYGRYYAPAGLENLRRIGPDMPLRNTLTNYFNIPFDQVDLNHNGFIDPEEVTEAARLLRGLDPLNNDSFQSFWSETDPSWQLNVSPDAENQHQDQLTINFEREVVKDLSFSATFIYKKTGNILANVPINAVTGEMFEYERVPYTTSYGQNVDLFSVVMKDYNGDGVISADDLSWISSNTAYEVRNLNDIEGVDADRTYKGMQFVVTKRFSHRAQMLASFLYSDSNGPANRNNFQDWNIEGPMIMDTTWVLTLNHLVNNLEGPLPFTPKYEFKVSGSYLLPKIDTDLGLRLRYSSGRPYWFLEDYPQLAPWNFDSPPPGAVVDTGGIPTFVGVDPNDPVYLPGSTIVDLRLGKYFAIGGQQMLIVSLDAFNIFNSNSVTNANYNSRPGVVTAVTTPSRKFRLGLGYQF